MEEVEPFGKGSITLRGRKGGGRTYWRGKHNTSRKRWSS
jgi:hypothetical protein